MRALKGHRAAFLLSVLMLTGLPAAGQFRLPRTNREKPAKLNTAEVEVPSLGIRIAAVAAGANPKGGERPGRPRPLLRVAAVRENGPAYYAGVVPGDVIAQTNKGGLWTTSVEFAQEIANFYPPGSHINLSVYYKYAVQPASSCRFDPPGMCAKSFSFKAGGPGEGRWITEVPIHDGPNTGLYPGRRGLAGVESAREDAEKRYKQLRMEDLRILAGNACKTTLTDVKRMASELQKFADLAGMSDQGNEYTFNDAAASACENSKKGSLPHFEAAVWAMTDARALDPCAYSPAADYSAIVNDPLYLAGNSKFDYDEFGGARFGGYLSRATAERKACFLDLIEAQLTGKEWRPRR